MKFLCIIPCSTENYEYTKIVIAIMFASKQYMEV